MKRIPVVVILVLAVLAVGSAMAQAMTADAAEICGGTLQNVTASFWPPFFIGFSASYILALVVLSLILLRAREFD